MNLLNTMPLEQDLPAISNGAKGSIQMLQKNVLVCQLLLRIIMIGSLFFIGLYPPSIPPAGVDGTSPLPAPLPAESSSSLPLAESSASSLPEGQGWV